MYYLLYKTFSYYLYNIYNNLFLPYMEHITKDNMYIFT